MKRYAFTLFALLTVISVTSQNRFDLFYVEGSSNFMKTPATDLNKNFETNIMSNLSVPIVFKDSSVWFTSLDYQYFSVNGDYSVAMPVEEFNLHGFILRTGYIYKFNSKKSLQVLFAPRLMSDFNASVSNSLQPGAIVMYENAKSKDMIWRVGVLYNQEFFGPYIVPVVYLDWRIAGKVKLTGLLPVYGKLYYHANEKFDIGLHFIGLTTSYRIDQPSYKNYYIDRRSIDVSLFTKVHLFDNVFMEVRAGYSLSRDYGLFAKDDKMDFALPLVNIGDDRIRANNEFGGSPFIRFRLLYSIPTNK